MTTLSDLSSRPKPAPNVPGFLASAPQTFGGAPVILRTLYDHAWFVGVFLAVAV